MNTTTINLEELLSLPVAISSEPNTVPHYLVRPITPGTTIPGDTISITHPGNFIFSDEEIHAKILITGAQNVSLQNLHLNGSLTIRTASVTITNCSFTCAPDQQIDYLVLIEHYSTCSIDNSMVCDGVLDGIGVDSSSVASLTNSIISNCTNNELAITGESKVKMTDCDISGGKLDLILIDTCSHLSASSTIFHGSTLSAIYCIGESSFRCSRCKFRHIGSFACSALQSGPCYFDDCEMTHLNDTVLLFDHSSLLCYRTTIDGGKGNGIFVRSRSYAIIEECIFKNTDWPLIALSTQSTMYLSNTLCDRCAMGGVVVKSDSKAVINNTTIRNCLEPGFRVIDSHEIYVDSCSFEDCQYSCIEMRDFAGGYFKNCSISGPTKAGVEVYTGSSIVSQNMVITGPFEQAVWVHHGGECVFDNLVISPKQKPIIPERRAEYCGHLQLAAKAEKRSIQSNTEFLLLETKWPCLFTKVCLMNFGLFDLIQNPGAKRGPELIPMNCLTCGEPVLNFHLAICGHSPYCKKCWTTMEPKPKFCHFCHLPVEKGISRMNCSDDGSCPICCYNDIDAIMIPCGHTICHECAYRWFATAIECPYCREANNELRKFVTYA